MNRVQVSLKRRLLRGSTLLVATRLYTLVLVIGINGFLARWMSKAELAQYLVSISIAVLMSVIGMAGINQSMLRFVAGNEETNRSSKSVLLACWRDAALFSVFSSIVVGFLLYRLLSDWLEIREVMLAPILVTSVLLSAHQLFAVSLRSLHQIGASGLIEGYSGGPIAKTVFLSLAPIAIPKSATAMLVMWLYAAALLATLPVAAWLLSRSLRTLERRDPAPETALPESSPNRSILLHSLPFLGNQILVYFATEFDVIIAKATTSPEATALYGNARRLAAQMVAPFQLLTVSVASSIAELHAAGDRSRLQKLLSYSSTIGAVTVVPILTLGVVFAPEVLTLVFGESYRAASAVFSILLLGQVANCLSGQSGVLLTLCGQTTYLFLQRAVFAVALIAAGYWAGSQFGISGIAVTSALVVAMQNLSMWIAARLRLGYWTQPFYSFTTAMKARR